MATKTGLESLALEETFDSFERDLARQLYPEDSPSNTLWQMGMVVASRFRIIRELGRGGMGQVVLARDQELGRLVAIKARVGAPPEQRQGRARWLRTFRRDAVSTARLNHPHIVTLYHVGIHEQVPFMVLEYVEGSTLRQVLNDAPPCLEEALRWSLQLTDAMAYAHEKGVIHRDLKPDNIMVTATRQLKVLDFGVALMKVSNAELQEQFGTVRAALPSVIGESAARAGTLQYMAPEQQRGDEGQDEGVDIWALGLVLRHMLSIALSHPDQPRSVDIPERVNAMIRAALAHDRQRRPASVAVMRSTLEVASLELSLTRTPVNGVESNMVAYANRFIGRDPWIQSLDQLVFDESSRLINLLGPAGVGKTRLAVEWAMLAQSRYDHVCFVDLSEASDELSVLSVIATALRQPLQGARADDKVLSALRDAGRAVVLLDNCEHCVETLAPLIRSWLALAQRVQFVLTSRAPLHLSAERVLTVTPLEASTYTDPGVLLFEERARETQPGWSCPPSERPELVALVEELDGLPLAIDLAAARARMLSPRQMRGRMSQRFALLRASHPARRRHAALDVALDFSWNLLTMWEQAALAQASVFEGGFTLQAAEEVICIASWPDAPLVMDVLNTLVDQCLLTIETHDRQGKSLQMPRFSMLSSIHAYAARQHRHVSAPDPDASAAVSAAQRRHCRYFAERCRSLPLDVYDKLAPRAVRPDLIADTENFRVAIERCIANDWADEAYPIVTVVCGLWERLGPFLAAINLLVEVLETLSLSPPHLLRLRGMRGKFLILSARFPEALDDTLQALDAATGLGETRLEAMFSTNLAVVMHHTGQFAMATDFYRRALSAALTYGNPLLESVIRANMASFDVAMGRLDDAKRGFERAVKIFQELGNTVQEATHLGNLALVNIHLGLFDEARTHCLHAIERSRAVGNIRSVCVCLGNLATIAEHTTHVDVAIDHMTEAVALARNIGARRVEAVWLGNLGRLISMRGDHESARQHLHAALHILQEIRDHAHQGLVLAFLAHVHQRAGDLEAAEQSITQALAVVRQTDDRVSLVKVLCFRARICHAQGEVDEARQMFDKVMVALAEITPTYEVRKAVEALRIRLERNSSTGADD